MFNFLNNSISELRQFDKQIQKINLLEDEISRLTENEIKERINNLIKVYQKKKVLIRYYVKVLL
jgi:preprotein translocase subunit SecA